MKPETVKVAGIEAEPYDVQLETFDDVVADVFAAYDPFNMALMSAYECETQALITAFFQCNPSAVREMPQ